MISVVIAVTKGEEELLDGCIDSIVGLADEIVVFNLGEKELLQKVSRKYVFRVIEHSHVDYIEKIRWKMIDSAKKDWVLILDPDERIPLNLSKKLEEISSQGEFDAVNIPRQNIFFGKWIRHTNWWPDKQIRFFRKGKVNWPDKIHTYPEVKGKTLELPVDEKLSITHFGYSTLEQFLERQNRYSEVVSENAFKKGVRFSWFRFFWEPLWEFVRRYIRHVGFLDGFWGFSLSYLMAIYKMTIWVKIWEKEKVK